MHASEGSLSNSLHVEDIGFVLREDNISFHVYDVVSKYYNSEAYKFFFTFEDLATCLYLYNAIGAFISFIIAFFISYMIFYHYERLQKNFLNNQNLFTSTFAIGLIIEFSEFVAMCVYIKGNPNPTPLYILWAIVLILYLLMCAYIVKYKFNKIKVSIIFFSLQSIVFLTMIYAYALPAFLLLLVYPTKVIAIGVYFITYIFVASILSSVSIPVYMQLFTEIRCSAVIYLSIMLCFVVVMFIQTFVLVYALVLGQASAITAGPYTVLSLIPSVAITVGSWTLKFKIFGQSKESDTENPEEETQRSASALSREESEDPECHNVIPLVSVNDEDDNFEPNNSQV